MKLFIDGAEADINASTAIKVSLSIASVTELEKSQTGYSKPFVLPATPVNRQIFGYCNDLNSAEAFNHRLHTARIEQDGCVIMSGTLYIIAYSENDNGSAEYSVSIIGPGKEWVRKAAATTLRNIGIEFNETISDTTIGQSWTWNKPVRFLPVQRDSFAVENNNSTLFPPVKILSFEDYHPFLHVKTMFRTILASAGYAIESAFMDGEMFNSLYMSGNYPQKNIDGDKSKMNFLAGRFENVSATANSTGKVYADPFSNLNTVGNIVETADPREEKNGKVIENVFCKNDCFTKIGNRIAFVPTHSVVVGFEFKINYKADYYIADRHELKSFDKIYLGINQARNYKVINSNSDRKNTFRTDKTFLAIVFDHQPGDTYQFRYDELANDQVNPENPFPGEVTTHILTTFGNRTQTITATGSKPVANPQIWIKPHGSSSYEACTKDWALYDGNVTERGEIEIEMTVRCPPERIMPSNPKYFDQIYFGGAEPGMNFTLGKSTTLRPLFAGYPYEGTAVKFEDVAAHEVNCFDFVNAIRHMFNLAFFTDSIGKKVRIEPRKDFYRSEPVVDWSRKIDFSKPIRISDPGNGLPQIYTMRYQTGDGAVTRWNRQNNERFGSYSWDIRNRFAKDGEKVFLNPIFTASMSASGGFPSAPAAILTQVGDRDSDVTMDAEELNFPAKIVSYLGMVQLPESQKWGWPSYQHRYPLLAFRHSGNGTVGPGGISTVTQGAPETDIMNGFSLCFEDRDSIEGLHKFYDRTIEMYDNSKRLEAYICLSPEEIEPFVCPNSPGSDFGGLYRLVINGENVLYRLEQICDYDPNEPSTKCVFIKEI